MVWIGNVSPGGGCSFGLHGCYAFSKMKFPIVGHHCILIIIVQCNPRTREWIVSWHRRRPKFAVTGMHWLRAILRLFSDDTTHVGLRRGDPCHGHPEWAAAHVVEADFMAELN